MLTRAFNCSDCEKPFGCTVGELAMPILQASRCRACTPRLPTFTDPLPPQSGLMNFLNQPAFKRTDEGYDYTLPINEPMCLGCNQAIRIFDGELAFVANCAHYICQGCDRRRLNPGGFVLGVPPLTCTICRTAPNGPKPFPADTLLAAFSSSIKDCHIKELSEALQTEKARLEAIVAKQKLDRDRGAVQRCRDCGIEQPVARLFLCNDCTKVVCGFCSFNSHREHSVDQLLGLELGELQNRNDQIYTETLEGLHGNLRYIHTNIDEAVEKVVSAGRECLAKISTSAQYEDAQNIATTIDKAANKFEQHCEEYIPVARRFATKLTELGEELTEYRK